LEISLRKIICEDTGEEFIKYSAYMQSKHWALKKKAFRACKLYKGCCAVCGKKSNLHIHHRTYKRIGNEYLKDLVALCEMCHFKLHDLAEEYTSRKKNIHSLVRVMRRNHKKEKENRNNKKKGSFKAAKSRKQSDKDWLAQNYK
jgi:hypothetical protein